MRSGEANGLAGRLARLSPERRKLLEGMRARRGGTLPTGERPEARVHDRAPNEPPVEPEAPTPVVDVSTKAMARRFYDSLSRRLNTSVYRDHALFLNYGYVANGALQHAGVELPAHYLNRNCMKLVLELIGDCDVEGCSVLDVGCGRGGTIYVIHEFFKPKATVGLDLSWAAIAFCAATHRYPNARFLEGDAEALPFRNEAFDVVTNVESSHNYPRILTFYTEVLRVLHPGGCFLYTDLMPTVQVQRRIEFWRAIGFALEREQDITGNVLAACDESASIRVRAFDFRDYEHRERMREFLGVPGSPVYNDMKSGQLTYRIFRLRKDHVA